VSALRRVRFAARVGRRSPRLLGDYLRLWAGARRPVEEPAGSPAGEVLTWEEAARLAAPDAALSGSPVLPAARGPAHATAVAAVANSAGDWTAMDADASLGELAYALVRALRPAVVVETGVAQGISSVFVLAALEDNGQGELHSVDLPPPRMVEADLVGAAIPNELRPRWHYHWGSSRRLLPAVLREAAGDRRLFIHDSDHSYDNMRWELETAWRALGPGDVLLCDDANFHAGFADAAESVGALPLFVEQPGTGGLTGLLIRAG
jgi:predicted O-methyltransferase YrrM